MEKTIVRRPLRFGAFEVDLQARELRKHGIRIRLQDQPFQVLTALLEHAGTVVTRKELQTRIWPTSTLVDCDLGLNTAVTRLRQALGDTADNPRFIETLPRIGYRFIAPLSSGATTADIETPARSVSALDTDSVLGDQSPTLNRFLRPRVTRLWAGLAVVVSVAVVAIGTTRVTWQRRLPTRGGPVNIESIAVLPLENLSRDPDQQYFADGMTDALITDLAQIGSLRVISRTSVMRYKETQKSLRSIAKELHVDAIVEGTVIRSADRVRISAQLIQADTDRHVWARSYERAPTDIVALLNEVAQAIADEIRVTVSVQQQIRLRRASAVDPRAYDMYLRGRYLLNTRTETGFKKGITYLDDATKTDSMFALAYAALADAYLRLGFWGVLAPDDAYPQSTAAAKTALSLDDTLAWAHTILAANRSQYEYDWAGADREFQRALELDPNGVPDWYPGYLSLTGRVAESLVWARRARQLDPLSLPVWADVSTYAVARRYEEAISELRKLLDIEPNYAVARFRLGVVYQYQGSLPEAIAEFERAIAMSDRTPMMLARLGNAYARSGRQAEATKIIKELAQRPYVSPLYLAMVYVGLGDHETALDCLERAYHKRGGELQRLRVEPLFDSLHSDPRFADLVRRMHFPA